MGATFPRVTVWSSGQDVNYGNLNGEFQNILDNLTPSGMDDYSSNAAQMQIQTSPGAQGSESLATSAAGELARIRYVINRMIGGTYWYDAPALAMSEIAALVNSATNIPDNRIVSGRVRSATDGFPIFLVPDGTAATVALKGATTNFKVYVDGALSTVSSDLTKTGMSLAPSTNNTCLVNDALLTAQTSSKYAGEVNADLPYITIDTVGSEISALVGKYAAFKTSTEYFVAFVNSATQLTRCKRGAFFDSSDAPVVRVTLADNQTITLMRLHWVFYKNDNTLFSTTNNPSISSTTPASPTTGDMWYDLTNTQWKQYDGATFVASNAHLIGWAITDTAGCKAARSFDFYAPYSSVGTSVLEKVDNATLRTVSPDTKISVAGNMVTWDKLHQSWDMTASGIFDASYTEQANTDYFFYVTELGDVKISPERPYDRRGDLYGHYHPYHLWRAVGFATNDGSSNLGTPTTYGLKLIRSQTFTAGGNWDTPGQYPIPIWLFGCGGGGGGGGGGGNDALGTSNDGSGGGGGGGAVPSWIYTTALPYQRYAVGIGSGGSAGAGSANGTTYGGHGGSGGNTTFGSLATFAGATGGRGGTGGSLGNVVGAAGGGGGGSTGGIGGGIRLPGGNGGSSPTLSGGSGGTSISNRAGGGGGGGHGGNGGNGSGGGASNAGSAGTANTGGGGGGGGGGCDDGGAHAGGSGGAGGSGFVTVYWETVY